MKVILTEKVKTLGNVGDVVNVSAGFARNFLIPNGNAVIADDSNKKSLAHTQKLLAKKVGEEKATAEATAKKLGGVKLELIKKVGANGKLFGSITNADLSKELEAQGIDVERRVIVIENPIKSVGTFTVKAKLFSGVEAKFSVEVKQDPNQVAELKAKADEAQRQKEAAAAAAALAQAEGSEDQADSKKELTEEEKLKEEANKILRSY